MVLVPVSVLNAAGSPQVGLDRSAFRIFEDGVEQTIHSFAMEDAPVSIGIVFDSSKSMADKLPQAREAVRRLFDHERKGDQYQLVTFNDAPALVCPLTTQSSAITASLGSITARGWTSLYDAIYYSSRLMRKASNFSRALVVLSDGADNFSRYRESELRSLLLEAGVVIYAISLDRGFLSLDSRSLRHIAEDTGGKFYGIDSPDDLSEAVASASAAIRHHYVLGYISSRPQPNKFRRIRVDVRSPKGDRLTASWRSGYYSPDSY